MSSEHDRAREIYLQASVIEARRERDAFLSSVCGTNSALRAEVDEMLRNEPGEGRGGRPKAQGFDTVPLPAEAGRIREGPGTTIGRYKLLERIGEGGFGVVYMAEQLEPVSRRVALKIIKEGMDTQEVVARFEAERQALALMDHPNVARVLDGGATDSGRPFFVMELVSGLPITDFCDRNRLTTRERLELLISVCQAAQHAHSKGIVHRDLKPSNILVTMQDGRALPKVIDFGIAKAMQAPLTEKTLFTRFGHMVGTPVYMSPEQLTGVDVDTRSDIYSLGVILYELLTGNLPFDWEHLRQAGQKEILRVLEEEDPPPPSTRLTRLGRELATVAHHRDVSPRRLTELLRGDLDWITMKALQKNRSRRYATPMALAEDLQRHLEHQPVLAGPPRVGYRALKFVRRHRYAVAAAGGIGLSLVVGLVLATIGFLRANEERHRAFLAEQLAGKERQAALVEAQRARTSETQARLISYASDMALAGHALDLSNLGRALSLLRRHLPGSGEEDLRGWEWRYLWQQCRSGELFQLGALSNSVVSLSVSADGRLVGAADITGRLAMWDVPGRASLFSTNASRIMALSPDGKVLVEGNQFIRDGETGLVLRQFPGDEAVKRLAFSPDGSRLAGLVGQDGLNLWNTADWKLEGNYKGFPCASLHFGHIAFPARNDWLAVGTEDGRVQIVDARNGQVLHGWQAHTESIAAIAVSADSKLLATGAGYSDDQIKLWRPTDGTPEGVLRGHQAWIISLAFSPAADLLASASADQTICLWDLPAKTLRARLRGHLNEVWAVVFLPDGKTLASADKDGLVKFWRVPATEARPSRDHAVSTLRFGFLESLSREFAFTPDSREVLAVDQEGRVTRRSLPAMRAVGSIDALGTNNFVLASSTKLQLAAALAHADELRIWSFTRQALVTNLTLDAGACRFPWVGFADGNRRLVGIFNSTNVVQWDVDSWRQVSSWNGTNLFGAVSLSPDGRWLAVGTSELTIYAPSNGLVVARIPAHKVTTDAVAFSPDGTMMATGSQEGLAKLWRTGSWQEIGTLRGHLRGVHGLAFSVDGRRLATGSSGNEAVKLWDVATLQEVLNLSAPGDLTFWVSFSPDGRTLMALGNVFEPRCWSAPLVSELGPLN